ncbi:MAG TPA: GFA family protein [Polyangiaceae bacterium]|nr:GFA family protein [Polyangiaceae bacterium]
MTGTSRFPLVCEGGCHCGAVRFRATIRRAAVSECNCSMCRKKAPIHSLVPDADFELLSGGESLTKYTFNTHVAQHLFCRHCGIHSFGRPRSQPDKISVNLRCLDEDLLGLFEIARFDGQNWEATMAKWQKT